LRRSRAQPLRRKAFSMTPVAAPRVIALTADLFFAMGIRRTAESLGFAVELVQDLDALVEKVREPGKTLVLLELEVWRPGAVRRLREAHGEGLKIVAFGSHMDYATRAAAGQEGCDVVMPRSAFAKDVAGHLKKWAG
jgi:DNA-binding response OmpR family regulator